MSESSPQGAMTLGIDLGTSAVKVVAVSSDGAVLGEAAAGFPTLSTLPQQAEQAPCDWLRAVSNAMRMLGENLHLVCGIGLEGVAAVGLTGQLPTLVCLTAVAPLEAAITWKDGRADAWAAARIDAARRAQMYSRTGMPIDGRYLAPMLEFHFARRLGDVQSILSAKDYLLWVLTGLRLTEPSTAAGYGIFDLQAQCFSAALAEFWNLPPRLLPQLRPANTLAGPLSDAGAELLGLAAGIPVSTGAADSVCAAFCMAGLDERIVSISFGSSAVIIDASAAPRLDPGARYLLTPHVTEGWYGREMDLLATGTGYRWLSELFGWPEGEIDRIAAGSVPGAHGLIFAPYLAGAEQGALWNPRLDGALFGLNLRHARADIARAYLEGVCYEVKRCVEVLAEAVPVEAVKVSGNIVRSPGSLQMLADILDRPVTAVPDKSPAAIGAALMARRLLDNPGTPQGRATASAATCAPDRAAVQRYAALYPEYVARAARCGG